MCPYLSLSNSGNPFSFLFFLAKFLFGWEAEFLLSFFSFSSLQIPVGNGDGVGLEKPGRWDRRRRKGHRSLTNLGQKRIGIDR